MNYDYRKLKGKIKEVFDTQRAFARDMEMSEATLTNKLRGKYDWTQSEMNKAARLLGIDLSNLYPYFFTPKVKKS